MTTITIALSKGRKHGAGELGQAFAQAEAAIESEFNTREFTDFAVWIGEQADQCPPPGMG